MPVVNRDKMTDSRIRLLRNLTRQIKVVDKSLGDYQDHFGWFAFGNVSIELSSLLEQIKLSINKIKHPNG